MSDAAPGRLRLALVGAGLFGVLVPALFFGAMFAATELSASVSQGQAFIIIGLVAGGVSVPVSAVIGGVVSALGGPEHVWLRRGVALGVLVLATVAFWTWALLAP